jgi:hypothetical protein
MSAAAALATGTARMDSEQRADCNGKHAFDGKHQPLAYIIGWLLYCQLPLHCGVIICSAASIPPALQQHHVDHSGPSFQPNLVCCKPVLWITILTLTGPQASGRAGQASAQSPELS